jgi:drug/metabolite transporter (DMT)-like permease
VAVGNIRRGITVLTANSWGMAYGAIGLYAAALVLQVPITVSTKTDYLVSLFYLSFVSTVLAFWAYMVLLARIGADRASYTTLIFPVVALMVSSVVEDYRWTLWSFAGLALVLAGNWLAMRGVRA